MTAFVFTGIYMLYGLHLATLNIINSTANGAQQATGNDFSFQCEDLGESLELYGNPYSKYFFRLRQNAFADHLIGLLPHHCVR